MYMYLTIATVSYCNSSGEHIQWYPNLHKKSVPSIDAYIRQYTSFCWE